MTFLETHPWRDAFIANLLERLAGQIVGQGEDLLAEAGLVFPSRAVSSVLLMGERGQVSAAEIAKTLGQPHQLVAQRIELLIGLGVVARRSDPADRRRKVLTLTKMGLDQYDRLQHRLTQAEEAFGALFEEIECDLSAVAMRAMAALDVRSLVERVNDRATVAPGKTASKQKTKK